jgi:hypothetical protein
MRPSTTKDGIQGQEKRPTVKHRMKGTVLTGNNNGKKEATKGYIAYHFIPTPYGSKTRAFHFDM